ncbi:MAG: proline--tRNA ligase [Chloroflexi bacterium]|nr:proline--tRNA ligase [Chloroflexota bacterium]
MRRSKLFTRTTRETPSDAEIISHKLMLKSGMVHQVASGVYTYMPLAWKSIRKIEYIIRDEMDKVNGQEIRMPVLQPLDIWDISGRAEAYGPDLFRLHDRRDRDLVLAPTHEELLTNIIKTNVLSYKDLPVLIYQIQTKFRDEPRPRGGLIRVREFDMKDAYSFDYDQNGLDLQYDAIQKAYKQIYKRCGLDIVVVEADSGAIGGKDSHEFVLISDSGEDSIIICKSCNYAANEEKAQFNKSWGMVKEPELFEIEKVHTPDVRTIDNLSAYLNISKEKTLKVVFYINGPDLLMVVVRGDLDVNEVKLSNILGGASQLRIADKSELCNKGFVPGFSSPVNAVNAKIIVDDSVNYGSNYVVGANEIDYHFINVNFERDFKADLFGDIALASENSHCINCNSKLNIYRGIEVGHTFKLGTRYSEVFDAKYPDKEGQKKPIIMGCYGIGVGRLLSAIIEQHNDEKGIIFPHTISPYQIYLIAINVQDEDVLVKSELLYSQLNEAGFEVLYDDRKESAGVKFNDADLLGIPIRVILSPRNLEKDVVEIGKRTEKNNLTVKLDEVLSMVKEFLLD